MKTRLEKYLFDSNDLPTTKEDNRRTDLLIAMTTFGVFATRESAAFARANRENTILRYKQKARDAWMDNHIKVISEMRALHEKREEIREKFPSTSLQESLSIGFVGFRR